MAKLPLKCREIDISTDQDMSFISSLTPVLEYMLQLENQTKSKVVKPTRIQGSLTLSTRDPDFLLIESDPIFDITNEASVDGKLLMTFIYIAKDDTDNR